MKYAIVKQIFKEFIVQIILSLIWAYYQLNLNTSGNLFADFLKDFSASLFLLSWIFGQVVRVKKQQKVESEFGNVKNSLLSIVERIEEQAKTIVGLATGGYGIVVTDPIFYSNNQFWLGLSNFSEFPQFDIVITCVELHKTDSGYKFHKQHSNTIGQLYPKFIMAKVFEFDLSDKEELRLDVSIRLRNHKQVSQSFLVVNNDNPDVAQRLIINKVKSYDIPLNFPNYDKSNPDSLFDQ